ncbi:ABC transporter ATP-binding protein [Streptomyces chartreusis]|uniref:ABC transporter ATP-binding protein n=1 Tax=Streptomyces chartreusis TaxID=1969 RepID=UPI0033D2EC63
MPDPILSIRGLSVEFRAGKTWNRVTEEVTFDVPTGKTLAVVGESGSGKSVTAMSIMDLLPSNARRTGVIELGGENLIAATPARMRQLRGASVAMVFQEPMTALNPVHTIGTLLEQAITSHAPLPRAARHERCLELLDLVKLPDPERRLRQYPHQLSGGQRQRAMIAMSLASRPKLLIADEPTTALDVTAQAGILDLLLELQSTLGMSILMITHDMGVVADVADRVVVMDAGRVVEEAEVGNLFARPQAAYTRDLLTAVPFLGHGDIVQASPAALLPAVATAPPEGEATPLLQVQNLTIEYPSPLGSRPFRAVDDVSFKVGAGESLGLVGESGSGKTTIGRAIMGLVPVTGGSIDVAGVDVTQLTRSHEQTLRRTAAIIFQDPASSLNPRATIGESIGAPLRWNKVEPDRMRRRKRVLELLDQVRLPANFADRFPHELSGGQRQRVGIARALAMRPKLLVADEPTSALDVSVQASVLELLQQLRQELGFACLFISHDLSVVEQLAHNILVLKDGAMVEQADTRQILHHPQKEYTQRLVAAIPVPDPVEQRKRRDARQQMMAPKGR